MDSEPAIPLQKFTKHSEDVLCCDFSPDSSLVVSCDRGSSIIVSMCSEVIIINPCMGIILVVSSSSLIPSFTDMDE